MCYDLSLHLFEDLLPRFLRDHIDIFPNSKLWHMIMMKKGEIIFEYDNLNI